LDAIQGAHRAAGDDSLPRCARADDPRRLGTRLPAPVHADAELVFHRYASDQDVTRYLAWPRHRTLADTQAFLTFSAVQWEREGAGPYLIWARDDGELLGSTGLELEPAGRR
jgi:RimJ/RimL family protein N-acetyltransferase